MRRKAMLVLLGVLALRSVSPLWAAGFNCQDNPIVPGDGGFRWEPGPNGPDLPPNCAPGDRCYPPKSGPEPPYITTNPPGCDATAGPCVPEYRLPLEYPGEHQNTGHPEHALAWVFPGGGGQSGCPNVGNCGHQAQCGGGSSGGGTITNSSGELVIPGGPVTCPDTGHDRHVPHDVTPVSCNTCCRDHLILGGADFSKEAVAAALGCSSPPKGGCNDSSCESCGDGGTPLGGGGPAWGGDGATGPGATFRYTAGGVGAMGWPGSRTINRDLGRGWMHDYAERIVTTSNPSKVWFLTKYATFREYKDLDSDGHYEIVSPTDETRQLEKTLTGWTLTDLAGMVMVFDSAGRWVSTTDLHGNAKTASYGVDGKLASVLFPDGRREDFAYGTDGRLASITEVGVGGAASRTWTYEWKWLDLWRVTQPDGLRLEMTYGDGRHPGYLTRIEIVHPDELPNRRVLRAWQYDAERNVTKTWKGDAFPTGPNATEVWSFSYDDPEAPTQTTVTDPLGQVSVFDVDRETDSGKTRVLATSGSCPTCSTGPNVQRFFEDPANPLKVTREIDARGVETRFEHDGFGQLLAKHEAVGTPEERVTRWEYHPVFPGLVTAIIGPTAAGQPVTRRIDNVYDPVTGELLSRTESGAEATYPGGVFSLTTHYSYTPEGQVATVDPPGFGAADVTSFTYDPARGGLVMATRTDPLVGTTTYHHDAFNRRTGVTDSNGVLSETRYDVMGRVTFQIERSAAALPGDPVLPADLVTEHRYTLFGERKETRRPGGGQNLWTFDAVGRVKDTTVTDNAASSFSRTLYTYNDFGHRIREEHQGRVSGSWVTKHWKDFVYANRCHLAKTVQADGAVLERAFDCNGNLAHVWDENHPSANQTAQASTSYAYDPLNRVKTLTQPWAGAGGGNAVTSYQYNVFDNLAAVMDAEGNTTSYTYSDRGLLTAESSSVSGTTTHRYSEKGELVETTDARGVTKLRTLDAAGRVVSIDYPGTDLDTTRTYDDPLVPFSKGRLTKIEKGGSTVAYAYDRWGRTTQDGALSYTLDKNGDPLEIGYAGNVKAVYTYQLPRQPKTLKIQRTGLSDISVVTRVNYLPNGPLEWLEFGTTREIHSYNARYLPTQIKLGYLSATYHQWDYTTDGVGNVTQIQQVSPTPAVTRTYAYQDYSYFLTQGDGPWGTRSWTYDKIGNRLSETRSGVTDNYTYVPNGTGGNTAELGSVALGTGGTRTYAYGPAGHLEQVTAGANAVNLTSDATGQLSQLARPAAGITSDLSYDGRGFLTDAAAANPVTAAYSSSGTLHHTKRGASGPEVFLFYFGNRPVAQMNRSGGTDTAKWLAVDHLGTPIAKFKSSTFDWRGGFEPFGADWNGAQAAGVFLRFPGQWLDEAWKDASLGAEVYYNVHRWYEHGIGRYGRVDPAPFLSAPEPYLYSGSNPTRFTDRLGLFKLDPSCDCATEPTPDEIRQEVRAACERLKQMITDKELLKCVDRSCDKGKIICGGEDCGKPIAYTIRFTVGKKRLTTREFVLCLDKLAQPRRPGCIGEVAVHEWAHGCWWEHGDDKGVPGNDGTIGCAQ